MPDCIFCKIASGEIQSLKVFEDDFAVAFLDINPGVKGQLVLTTKQHVKGLHELSPGEAGRLCQVIRLLIIGLTQSVGCAGVNVIYSLGEVAGQRSDHMIVYLLPRFKDDGVVIHWNPKQGDPKVLQGVAQAVAKAVASIPKEVISKKPVVVEEPEEEVVVVEEEPRVPDY